jgi:hypothetical protein
MMSDEEFAEYLRLVREERDILRSLLEKPAKAKAAVVARGA